MKKHLLLILLISSCLFSYSQNNVGVGTLTPNPNAALEIESTDKGLLIPRLTTAQRNIFGVGLTNTENSMLVYDVNDSVFYYWKATVWVPIPGINTDDQNIDSVRLNPTDSILTVYIEDGLSASVDLKTAFDNTDEQTLNLVGDSLEISNGNKVLFIDNDTTNEKIDSLTYQNDTLIVYEGDSVYKTEIIGGEWSDAEKIGLANFIYAKQALNNGTSDTVVITDDGFLGVGLVNPDEKIQVDGNIRIGRITDGGAVQPPGSGNALYFSGGPDVSGIFDTDNSDWIGMGRFNLSSDVSELRIRLGDNQGIANDDAFVLGSALISSHPWNEYFRVQSNGYVHIGTSALPAYPTNQLHLQGEINPIRVEGIQAGASTDSILTIDATGVIRKIPNSVQGEWNDTDTIGMNGFIYAKQALNNGTADTVVVTDDGKMGIGVSNPLADLHILRPVGKSQIRLETDKNNANSEDDTPGITFHQDGDLVRGYLGYIHGTYTPFTQPVFGAIDNSFLSMANNDANLISLQYAINDTIAMTIDNKRDVGIGTSAPTAKLTIAEDNVTMFMAALLGGGGKQGISSDGDLFLGGESNTYIVSDMNAGAALGDIIFGDRVLGYNTADAGTWVLDDEHMRIDGVTGNVGIGTSTPTEKLEVFNGVSTGTYTTTGWVHASDKRLKTNIEPVTNALDIVKKLEGVYYNWKSSSKSDRQIGFLAQDVKKVLPEVVVGVEGDISKGETLGMAYQNIVPVLVEALKEQQKEIEKLKNKENKEIDKLKLELEEIKKLLLSK
jgi:hypothetical protein